MFPKNVVTRKKTAPVKKPTILPPPPGKPLKPVKKPAKKKKPEFHDDLPKEKSELEKLTTRTAKELPAPDEEEALAGGIGQEQDDDEDDESEQYSDKFVLNFEGLEPFRVKSIELPKMIFMRHKSEQSIKDKSTFMIYFYSALTMVPEETGRAPYPWKLLMESCKKKTLEVSIDWLDAFGKKNSVWKFGGARVQGLDLGAAAYERPEIAEAAIEVSYDTINIDGVEF